MDLFRKDRFVKQLFFFREFKQLALFGYYSSEPGATIELQYELLTPEYKACAPIEDIGRAWFWSNFRHGL